MLKIKRSVDNRERGCMGEDLLGVKVKTGSLDLDLGIICRT
jgi:hypothetical protein